MDLSTNPSHKAHNALDTYPTIQHFVTEMCIYVHISVTIWCTVGYGTGAIRDLRNRSISATSWPINCAAISIDVILTISSLVGLFHRLNNCHSKCREISRDLVGHFEWRHHFHKGDTLSLITREINIYNDSFYTVRANGLAPKGSRPSAGRVVTKFGPSMYTDRHLNGCMYATLTLFNLVWIVIPLCILYRRDHDTFWLSLEYFRYGYSGCELICLAR